MKKLSIISTMFLLTLLLFSCETENIEETVSLEIKDQDGIQQKSTIPESCYTFEVKFNKYFYNLEQEKIKLKATIYFGGFGPGLYLGEYTINNKQTIKIRIPEQFRDNYQFSPNDRFGFEIDKISPIGNRFLRDGLEVNQLGSSKTNFLLPANSSYSATGPIILPYVSIAIQDCL